MSLTPDEQLHALTWNASEVIPRDEFDAKLRLGRPLRVKLGLDPGADHVTLGWSVVLRKLRTFQDLGHIAVLIVGDYTAQIGDPADQEETRPMLTADEVEQHAAHVLGQFSKILSDDNLEIRRNSEWLSGLGTTGLLELSTHYTVARMLERDDFAGRFKAGASISIREFLYPLLQGYDSVAVQADVELGGTDQHFNLMVGRHVQRAYGQEPQVVMTMPLIEGTDGVKKMSQSVGNYIGITEPPDEIFGKIMSIPDELMDKYFRLTTDLSEENITTLTEELPRPEMRKRRLASEIVRLYHGERAAEDAMARFDEVFVEHKIPDDIPSFTVPTDSATVYVPRLLTDVGFADSSTSARRLIDQGGVYVDGERLSAEEMKLADLQGRVLSVGKRRFVRLQ